MVSVLDSSVIDHGLHTNCIGGVMVSVLDSSVIDRVLKKNCIGDVMVTRFECDRSWVTEKLHRWCNG